MTKSHAPFFFSRDGSWQERLAHISQTMRELSAQDDPQQMVANYARRMESVLHRDRLVTMSRRGHEAPEYRVTRDSRWEHQPNPWRERDRLPLLRGGLLGELIYGDEARIIDELRVAPDDPSAAYFAGMRSAMAIPLFDQGIAMNMVVFMRTDTGGFLPDDLPEHVWLSNLFGRATQNLVLSDELRRAYEAVDNELRTVAEMQRSLLPVELPEIPGLDLAVHYETSRRAGGDYYDFFPLPGDRWGIFIADVTGHGTPAAVLMAITHAMAHNYPEAPCPPSRLLTRLNQQLARRYTNDSGKFVTAFYAIYDPSERSLTYSSAGHPPPRLKRCADGSLATLEGRPGLPLGIIEDFTYEEARYALQPGDQIVFYTDGITEAFNTQGEMYGTEALDRVLDDCSVTASGLMDAVLDSVARFTAGRPADDDRTLVVARVTQP